MTERDDQQQTLPEQTGRDAASPELTPTEKQLYQAKHLYATLSQVNQTIVRVKDRAGLFQSICDVAVQYGEFVLAWIGLLDEPSGDIRPAASNGFDLERWPFPIFNIDRAEMQDLLSVTAIRTGELTRSDNVQTDPRTRFLKSRIAHFDFRSMAAVPFQGKDGTKGVLNLVSNEAGLFDDEEELRLLNEIGSDISYALDHIASEERYRNTLDQMLEGCQIIDFDWRYVYINQAAARQGRSTPAELLGHTMMEMYPGIENTPLFEAMNECMLNRTMRLMENEFIYPDGSRGWFELSIQPAPEGIFILSVDISGRKRAEDELRASEATLKLFVENAPAAIAMFDSEMRYLAASRRFSQDYRLGEQDLIGRSHYDVFPEITERVKAIHRRCLAGSTVKMDETPFVRADGSLDWLRWEVRPWHRLDGEIGGIIFFSEVITERVLARQKIQESEAQYSSLFANMAEGIAYCQMLYEDGKPVDWIYHAVNQSFETLTGLEGIAGKKVTEAIPGIRETDPQLFELYGRVASTGVPERFEIFVEALRDWYSVSVYSTRKDYFVAVFDVVTERKIAEEKLRESEERFRSIYENTTIGLYRTTPDGRILMANPAVLKMLGYPTFEALASRDLEREGYGEGYERADFRRQIESQGQVLGRESGWKRSDGSTIFIRESAQAIRDESGQIVYYEGTVEDIHERKQAEVALKISEENYRNLVENSESGIAVLDRNGRILYANPWGIRIWEDENIVGKTIFDLFPKNYARSYLRAIHKVIDTQTSLVDVAQSLIHGRRMWFRLSMSPLQTADGMADRFLLNAWDITDLKEAEDAIATLAKFPSENPNPVIRVDDNGFILYANPASQPVLRLWGREVGQAVPPSWQTLIEAALQSGEHPPIEIDCGDQVFSGVLAPVVERGYVNIYASDVTERRRAELDLLASEAKYRSLIESSSSVIAMVDQEGFFHYANRIAADGLGKTTSEVIGKSMYDLFPAEAAEDQLRNIRNVISSGQPYVGETLFIVNNEVHWYITNLQPVHNPISGEVLALVNSQDITERKQAEQAVIENERQMSALVTSLDDIVIEVDEQGRYLNIWSSNDSLLAQPKEQLLGRRMVEVLGEANGRPFELAAQRVLASGEPVSIEYPLEVIGGKRWFVAKISPILAGDGSRRSVSMLVRDITSRKQAEREIQHRNEDLSLINALNEAVNQGEDIPGITEVFAREVRRMVGCQDVAIYLLSPDGEYIEMQSHTLPGKLDERIEALIGRPMPRVRIPLSEDSYFKRCLANEQGTSTSDPQVIQGWMQEFTETVFLPQALRPVVRKFIPSIYNLLAIQSVFTLPLISSGRTIGLLDISCRDKIQEETIQRIKTIGPQLTAVLLRKIAEQQVQLQIQRLSALSQIDRAISSSLDMRFSIGILLDEVCTQLEVDAAAVMLFNESSLMLEFFAGKGLRKMGINPLTLRLGEGMAGQVGLERKLVHIHNLEDARARIRRQELLRDEQFVEYFGLPLIAKGALKGVLEVFQRGPLVPDNDWLSFLETLAGQAAIAIDSAQTFDGLQRSNLNLSLAYDATIEGWSRAMDLRDRETEGHTQRVTEMTLRLAERVNFSQQERVHIRRGALLHDIGKLGVPDGILHKPGPLSAEEWAIMRQHPQFAHDMLASIEYLRPALDIPYCHHEMWDGKGYPRGLSGEKIPLAARLFAVVDVWDALSSDRPYRQAWSQEKVLAHIRALAGSHFDPQAVELFMRLIADLGERLPDRPDE